MKGIEQVRFTPPSSYALDIELLSVADLRRRVAEKRFRLAHQIDFFMLALITRGSCRHVIDYHAVTCKRGTLLLLQPGQAQQFDASLGWDGWIIICRPEFLVPAANIPARAAAGYEVFHHLPASLQLSEPMLKLLDLSIRQMRKDTEEDSSPKMLNALLRCQLQALLLRISMAEGSGSQDEAAVKSLQRFAKFRKLVEEGFGTHHHVSHYAGALGCTVKSLTRATQHGVGSTAKEYIVARINLEAKRLLTHTTLPVSTISDQLGFDEPTNFTKFFRREVGQSPAEFRNEHFSIYN